MDTSSGVLGQLARQVGGSWAQPAAGPRLNCLGACACSAALSGRGASVLGPLLGPAAAAGESIHGVIHQIRDDQNRNATFSADHKPSVTIESGDVFQVPLPRWPTPTNQPPRPEQRLFNAKVHPALSITNRLLHPASRSRTSAPRAAG